MAIILASAPTQPRFRLIECELMEPGMLEPLGEVVVVWIGGGTIKAAQPSHKLIGEGVVVLNALDGVVELGASFVGRGKTQRTVITKEAMPQVAELNIPVDRRGQVQPPRWHVVSELAMRGHEVGLQGVSRGLHPEVVVAEEGEPVQSYRLRHLSANLERAAPLV